MEKLGLIPGIKESTKNLISWRTPLTNASTPRDWGERVRGGGQTSHILGGSQQPLRLCCIQGFGKRHLGKGCEVITKFSLLFSDAGIGSTDPTLQET